MNCKLVACHSFSTRSSIRYLVQSLVDACNNNGVSCGVYSSASQWSAIFGSLGYSYGANFPLW